MSVFGVHHEVKCLQTTAYTAQRKTEEARRMRRASLSHLYCFNYTRLEGNYYANYLSDFKWFELELVRGILEG